MTIHPSSQVSIILPAYNEGGRLRETIHAIRSTTEIPHEIIVVNDGSTDHCCDFLRPADNVLLADLLRKDLLRKDLLRKDLLLIDLPRRQGVAHARNLGASKAQSPVLVAMDAHCLPQANWLSRLLDQLEKPGVGIVAPQISSIESPDATTFGLTIRDRELGVEWLHRQSDHPYPIPLAGCACLVMKRHLFEAIGRFDALRSYGMEDVELCIRCWLLGYSVMMVPDAIVAHWFKQQPFAVGWPDYLYNRLRTAILHFDGNRLGRILSSLQGKPGFADSVGNILMSDLWNRYSLVRTSRQHDADWFCSKFGIEI